MSARASANTRTIALTLSVAAITATGAWYGAGLKMRQEYKQERYTVLQATPAQRIEQMEIAKGRLLEQKRELQAKIERLEGKSRTAA
ncbi:hypothetical protein Tdes44962_MAKER01173 [Teratosphaeria destructans]|uniref:Uncharacterized protein n=1 Tax=Teratosphaeria destructans TaxID=418781 RepID=A0A9W7T1G5_9PEZI|nr:hypothetical protein Tdes44962_MAKER01173 [Teratosphaeria destructans]